MEPNQLPRLLQSRQAGSRISDLYDSDLVMLLKTLDCDRHDALTVIWYALLSLGALAERNALHRRSRQRDRRTKCFYHMKAGSIMVQRTSTLIVRSIYRGRIGNPDLQFG